MRKILIFLSWIITPLVIYLFLSDFLYRMSRPIDVKFPFKNIKNNKGVNLNIIAISAPFRNEEHVQLYNLYKSQGLGFLGISSYLDFPEKINNPFESSFHVEQKHNYLDMVSSWLYCTRKPSINMRKSNLPLLQLTEADMKNTYDYHPDNTIIKKYDFLYICLDDKKGLDNNNDCKPGWQSYNRNWELAKKCLKVMCSKHNLKGIVVGRTKCKIDNFCSDKIKVLPFMPYWEFQKIMQECKFLFVPNISDASPRVITEAICYNMPVIVNYNILGGWQNVIPGVTGEFFTNEHNISSALYKLILNRHSYKPRAWFVENRGFNSRKIFANFLKKNYKNINDKNFTEAYIAI
jgi:hypothetical protein